MILFSRERKFSSKSDVITSPHNEIPLRRVAILKPALFFICVIVLFSCKRPEQDVGIEVLPQEDYLNVQQTDTVTLFVTTVKEDSLRSDEVSSSLIGNHFDSEVGLTKASFYSQIRLSAPDIDFGSNPVCDSINIYLVYNDDSFGQDNDQTFEVFQLSEAMYIDSAYYTNQDIERFPDNLMLPGEETVPVDFSNGYVLDNEEEIPPALRLPLKTEFGQSLLDAPIETYDTYESFTEYFHGLYLRSVSTQGTAARINPLHVSTKVALYYHNDTDTLSYPFEFGSLTARFNHFEYEFNGDLAELATQDSVDGSGRSYIKAGSALKTKIEFPFINEFNEFENRILNKAELVVPAKYSSNDRDPRQESLFALTLDEDGDFVTTPDQTSPFLTIGGELNSATNEYRFVLTQFFQQYLNGDQPSNSLYLVSSNSSVTTTKVVVNGPDVTADNRNMRLILTFSN